MGSASGNGGFFLGSGFTGRRKQRRDQIQVTAPGSALILDRGWGLPGRRSAGGRLSRSGIGEAASVHGSEVSR